ncbi:cellulose binding domain-containing protein [Synechococcus sp. GEYO]|uniref:cellulose binding domain-containing protein n=1 Tax=Synechococcus sp. GEYO TaxID=2575511 RepID=UPI000E0FA18A
MTPSESLQVSIGREIWWGGFTSSLTVTNQSEQQLDNWSVSFNNNHRFYGEPWGVDVATEQLDGELYRYELSGADWGSSIRCWPIHDGGLQCARRDGSGP